MTTNIKLENLCLFIKTLEDKGIMNFDILNDDSKSFDTRIRLQKYVYLAKHFGWDLGYNHSLYLHGPYSSTLADDYYAIAKSNRLSKVDNNTVKEKTKTFANYLRFINKKDTEWLESAATLLSLSNYFKDRPCLLDRTMNMKDHIPKNTIKSALKTLEKLQLIKF